MQFGDETHLKLLYALYTSAYFGKQNTSYQLIHQLEISKLNLDTQIHAFFHLEAEKKDKQMEFLNVKDSLPLAVKNEYARLIQITKLNHYCSLNMSKNLWALIVDRVLALTRRTTARNSKKYPKSYKQR
jgi:hypothetical protein